MITHVTFYSTKEYIYAKISGDDKNILSGLLADSGGSGVEHLINLLSTFLEKLQKIDSKIDLGTNSWTAIVNKNETRIVFIADNDYFFKIETSKFIEIISRWLDFIKSNHGKLTEISFDIN